MNKNLNSQEVNFFPRQAWPRGPPPRPRPGSPGPQQPLEAQRGLGGLEQGTSCVVLAAADDDDLAVRVFRTD